MKARPPRVKQSVPAIDKKPYPDVIKFMVENERPTIKGDAITTSGASPPTTMRVRSTKIAATTLVREDACTIVLFKSNPGFRRDKTARSFKI